MCLVPAAVQASEVSDAPVTPVVADESLFLDDDYAEVVVLPAEPTQAPGTSSAATAPAEQPTATPAPVQVEQPVPVEQPLVTPTPVQVEPPVAPVVTPTAVEPAPKPAETPAPVVTPAEPAVVPVPPVAPREMTPEEKAVLDAEKPEPTPDRMEPPAGMQLIETYLTPLYASLSKRTPDGDWVTSHFKQPLVPREQTQVAVLGYHDFSNTKTTTEMRMKTAEFCRQMQFLHDSDICVISMQDFLEWRFGTRCLPARCVLITIDDGWKSVYTDAYPVLKAYGYPFTLYLYVRYVGVKGSSMTHEQLKEMMQHGATIGCHSWNHLYPSKWKRYSQTSVQYATQLQKEFIDSRAKLQEWFGNCSTYCYPGGYHTAPMRATLKLADYQAAFTVIEKKVKCDVNPYQVNRYMVFGVDTAIFRRAVNFDGKEGVDPTITAINNAEAPARAFFPSAFTGVSSPLKQTEKTSAEKAEATAPPAEEAAPEPQSATEQGTATEVSQPTAPATTPAVPAVVPAVSPAEQPASEPTVNPVTQAVAPAVAPTPAKKKKNKRKRRSSKKS